MKPWLFLATAAATRLESFRAGLHATHAGDSDAALTHFRTAVNAEGSLGKDEVSLYLALGEGLSRAGAADDAVKYLERALEMCEDHGLGANVEGMVSHNLAVAIEEAGGGEHASRTEALYRRAAAQGVSLIISKPDLAG